MVKKKLTLEDKLDSKQLKKSKIKGAYTYIRSHFPYFRGYWANILYGGHFEGQK